MDPKIAVFLVNIPKMNMRLEKLQRMEAINQEDKAYSMSKRICTFQIGKRKPENKIPIVFQVLIDRIITNLSEHQSSSSLQLY